MDLVPTSSSKPQRTKIIRSGLILILLTVIFAVAYTQSPLYTSNQNQYFLHGFADAGVGYLENDWLASTTETTPVFRFLVATTMRMLQNAVLFYVYYAALMGIYAASLLGIVAVVYDIKRSRTIYLLYIAGLFTVHSAAFRFLLSQTMGDHWKYFLEGGLAGQRLLGSVFQPSAFGVFLLLSIYLFLKGKPVWAVFLAVLAATIHPTYLLSAAALVLSFLTITFKADKSIKNMLLLGGFAFILVLPILAYSYFNFAGTPVETSRLAQNILVNYRIPHHARPDWWFDATAVIKIGIIILAIYVSRKSRLFLVLLIPFSIAAVLTVLQVTSGSSALALVFPWRLSTFLVPLSTALILAKIITAAATRFQSQVEKHQKLIELLSVITLVLIVTIGALRIYLETNRKLAAVENEMMQFVSSTHTPGDIFLVPKKMQDFRLATGSPVFIDFKSIPYRDTDVLEWYKRIQKVERFYKENDCSVAYELIEKGLVTRVVIPSGNAAQDCERLDPIYQDGNFGIYKLSGGNSR